MRDPIKSYWLVFRLYPFSIRSEPCLTDVEPSFPPSPLLAKLKWPDKKAIDLAKEEEAKYQKKNNKSKRKRNPEEANGKPRSHKSSFSGTLFSPAPEKGNQKRGGPPLLDAWGNWSEGEEEEVDEEYDLTPESDSCSSDEPGCTQNVLNC